MTDNRKTRLARYFEAHPPRTLSFREMKAVTWCATDSLDEASLHYQYVQKRTTHAFQFERLLNAYPVARERLRDAYQVVVVGPGFGDEIDIVEDVREGRHDTISAVEINRAAWGALGFERPYLRIRQNVVEVPVIQGPVAFIAVHVLRQRSLASDDGMNSLATEILRIAPQGSTVLSTLPRCYDVLQTRFAPTSESLNDRRGVDADELLVRFLETRTEVEFSVQSSEYPMSSRLAMITIGGAK